MSCGLTHFDFQSFRITLPAALRKFGLQVRNGRQRRIPFAGLVFGIRFPVQCRVRLWSVLLRQFVEFVFCLLIFAIVQCFPSVVVEFLHPVDPLLFAIFSLLLAVLFFLFTLACFLLPIAGILFRVRAILLALGHRRGLGHLLSGEKNCSERRLSTLCPYRRNQQPSNQRCDRYSAHPTSHPDAATHTLFLAFVVESFCAGAPFPAPVFSPLFPLAIPAALPAPLTKFLVPQSVFELMRTALV